MTNKFIGMLTAIRVGQGVCIVCSKKVHIELATPRAIT